MDRRSMSRLEWGLLGGLFGCALLLRVLALSHVADDYAVFLGPWYDHLRDHGGFRGLRDDVANYNVTYLYVLAGLTYLPVNPLTGIKIVSILFDGLLAWYVYRIVALRFPTPWM